jgi:anti-anti-sigma factor
MSATEPLVTILQLAEHDRLISVSGELDMHTAGELQSALDLAIEDRSERIVVDLAEVSFIDSIALGVLAGAGRRLRETGGRLGVVAIGPEVGRPFEVTGLDRVIPIAPTVTEVLERLV